MCGGERESLREKEKCIRGAVSVVYKFSACLIAVILAAQSYDTVHFPAVGQYPVPLNHLS